MNLDTDIISDQDELLILVDREDNELGFASKAECHHGKFDYDQFKISCFRVSV